MTEPVLLQDEAEGRALSKALASKPDARLHAREAAAALASAPHPPSNTFGDAFGPGDPVASLPTPPIAAGEGRSVRRLWLWRNFIDGRPEYWAFDNAFPIHLDCGDPQTLGEPCGYALLKPSRDGRPGFPDDEVLRRIASAKEI